MISEIAVSTRLHHAIGFLIRNECPVPPQFSDRINYAFFSLAFLCVERAPRHHASLCGKQQFISPNQHVLASPGLPTDLYEMKRGWKKIERIRNRAGPCRRSPGNGRNKTFRLFYLQWQLTRFNSKPFN